MDMHRRMPSVVVDRQGGLMRYQPLLASKFHEGTITAVAETPDISRYRIQRRTKDPSYWV